jgi:bacillithiol system protein YtxJ
MIRIDTIEGWQKVKAQSTEQPVLIYKHSVMCGNCHVAHDNIRDALDAGILNEPVYIVDTLEATEISDTISEELDIPHGSPQVIVMKDRQAIYAANSNSINPEEIAERL